MNENEQEETVIDDPQQHRPWWRQLPPGAWIVLVALILGIGALGYVMGQSGFDGADPAVDVEAEIHAHGGAAGEAAEVWTCSMHPQIRAPEPGQCPICGMDLIPASSVDGGEDAVELEPDQIRLAERARALAQIRTMEVRPMPLGGASAQRLSGRVEPAEDATRTVPALIGGRVDDLIAATTGTRIRQGEVIARLYSPQVYAAHRDQLAAKTTLERLSGAEEFAQRAARAQLEATRQKLRLLGLRDEEVRRMERAEEPWTSVPIRSPSTGTVLERMVEEGQYVQEGQGLYRLADLSEVWVQLDAYEADLQTLTVGQPVTLRVDALPGEQLSGKVAFVDPVVDPRTGTAQVRVEVANRDGALKPGMVARARLQPEVAAPDQPLPLVIPQSAPLLTGRRALVYVEHMVPGEGPIYEAREVQLGEPVGELYPVLAGLQRGERVVIHGAFVLDADLQIRGGRSLMTHISDGEEPMDEVPPAFRERLRPVVQRYLDIQESLAADDLAGARAAYEPLAEALAAADAPLEGADEPVASAWMQVRRPLEADLATLQKVDDITAARAAFANLTQDLEALFTHFGNPLEEPIRLAYCPMAFENEGGEWFQRAEQVNNVYFGAAMQGCGEIRETLAPAERLPAEPAAATGQGGGSHGNH